MIEVTRAKSERCRLFIMIETEIKFRVLGFEFDNIKDGFAKNKS